MVTRGVKVVDQVLDHVQLQWLVLSRDLCPDENSERGIVARHFRIPHEPWGCNRAFVRPVIIRRSRRRILFRQESGVAI